MFLLDKLIVCNHENLDKYRDIIDAFFKDRDDYEVPYDELIKQIKLGITQIWIYKNVLKNGFIMITQILTFLDKKYCLIYYLWGKKYNDWVKEILQIVEKWAKNNGCENIELWGRKGWSKIIQKLGYNEDKIMFTKLLKDRKNV